MAYARPQHDRDPRLAREDDRLDAHCEWVLTLLRAQPTTGWPDARRAARAHTLELLEGYARRRQFPRNRRRRDRMMPIFVDERGTTCAVADLMLAQGRHDVVAAIRSACNEARVDEMDVRDLAPWAHEAGLSVGEAVLVQPDYCPDPAPCWGSPFDPCDSPDGDCCVMEPDGVVCEPDGGLPTCSEGRCKAGNCILVPLDCDDEDPNTEDSCSAVSGCLHERTEPPVAADEVEEDGGCACEILGHDVTRAAAPLLAAVFLLAVARRRRRSP